MSTNLDDPEAPMIDATRDVQTLEDFRQRTPEFLRQIKETGEPIVLTVDGKAELIVQDAMAYRKLLALIEKAEVHEGIRRGLEDMHAGRVTDMEGFKERFRSKFGIHL